MKSVIKFSTNAGLGTSVTALTASLEPCAGQSASWSRCQRCAHAEAVLHGETHRDVSLVVASRTIKQRKKNPAARCRIHRDAYLSQLGPPRRRRREPCDQRDVVGREFLRREPIPQFLEGRRLQAADRHQI